MLHKLKDGSTVENVRILSLDGGGIRGVAVSRILEEIEEYFKKPIHELFDLVIGTSTGGLLSLLLTVPTKKGDVMTAKEARELYVQKGKDIFKSSYTRELAWWATKYLQDGLQQMVEDLYEDDKTLKDAKTHVGVVCTDEIHAKSLVLNSFRASKHKNDYRHNAKLSVVAKATTAAPTYFENVILEEPPKDYVEVTRDETDEYFVIDNDENRKNLNDSIEWYHMDEPIYRRKKILLEDGGTSNNNPSHLGYKLIKRYLKSRNITAKNIQIISLGTGSQTGAEEDPEENEDFWDKIKSTKLGVMQRLLMHDPFRVAGKAYEVHRKILSKYKEKKQTENYIRVQFKIDYHQWWYMDDHTEKNITSLVQAAEDFIFGGDMTTGYSDGFKKIIKIIEGSNPIREKTLVEISMAEEIAKNPPTKKEEAGILSTAADYLLFPYKMVFNSTKNSEQGTQNPTA